jgi:hypothetical protein
LSTRRRTSSSERFQGRDDDVRCDQASTPIWMSPSRRRSSSRSAVTRSTIRPTVSQATRSSAVIGVVAICWASQATTSSKSRVYDARPGPEHRLQADT